MQPLFFYNTFLSLIRVLVVGVGVYVGLIALVRVSGKRSLAKLNAFDFIVTIAIGSLLASSVINARTPLTDALLGIALLLGLQYLVAWVQVRWHAFRKVVRSDATVLAQGGRIFRDRLEAERVTEGELYQAMRSQGYARLGDVEAVVLETDGTFSVINPSPSGEGPSTLNGLDVPDAAEENRERGHPDDHRGDGRGDRRGQRGHDRTAGR